MDLLRDGALTTGQLSKSLPDLSRFAVMQHLGVLEEAGLVLPRREGRMRFNYLNPVPLQQVYERWMSSHASHAAETALHLKRYAENVEAARAASRKEVDPMDPTSYRLVTIELEMRIDAPRERVFDALTVGYGDWWPHRFKADSTVYCEPKIGGLLGESFSNGGGAIYGQIVYWDYPSRLMISGASALNRGMHGLTTDAFEEDAGGTILKRKMQLWGSVPEEAEKMFREGTRMLIETALKNYVEKGIKYVPEARS